MIPAGDDYGCVATYQQEVLDDFLEQYPEYKGERIEVDEFGKVYIHGNCAYPLIVKHAPTYEEWRANL